MRPLVSFVLVMRRRPEPLRYWRSTVLEDSSFHWNNWLAIRATVSGKHKEDSLSHISPISLVALSLSWSLDSEELLLPLASLESASSPSAESISVSSASLAFDSLGFDSLGYSSSLLLSSCSQSFDTSESIESEVSFLWLLSFSLVLLEFSSDDGCDSGISAFFIRCGSTYSAANSAWRGLQ